MLPVILLQAAFPVLRGGLLEKNQIVLSFDDGPNSETSPILLDVLQRNKIKALFFHVGVNIQSPVLMQRFLTEGHCVGVHTMSHAHLTSIPLQDAHRQIDESIAVFQNITHSYPRFFRPPYGEVSTKLAEYIHERGMISFMWDFDSADWRVHSDLASRIGAQIHRHGIVLLHEYEWTTTQSQQIIDSIRAHGFEIVHPLELLSAKDINALKSEACPSDVQSWCSYQSTQEKYELR